MISMKSEKANAAISIDIDYSLKYGLSDAANKNLCTQTELNSGCSSLTEMSSLSSVNMQAVKDYRQKAGDSQFLNQIKSDCKKRLEDVRKTNNATCSLSAFMAIPALIGYLAKLSCCRNTDFLRRNGMFKTKSSLTEADFKNAASQIDGIAYLEFVNRYLLSKTNDGEWKKDNGVAEMLYGMVRCGMLHGQTLKFGRGLKEKSYDTTSPSSATTQKNRLGNVSCTITHNRKHETCLADLESEIDKANGNPVTLVICADKLCDEIDGGIEKMFDDASSDGELRSSILETFENEPPITFIDFDKELQDIDS